MISMITQFSNMTRALLKGRRRAQKGACGEIDSLRGYHGREGMVCRRFKTGRRVEGCGRTSTRQYARSCCSLATSISLLCSKILDRASSVPTPHIVKRNDRLPRSRLDFETNPKA